MSKLNVLYFTYGETPRVDGVFESQVISLVEQLSKKNKLFLYSIIPIVNSGFYKSGFDYFNVLKKIKARLKNCEVDFTSAYSFGPQNLFYSSSYCFKLFHVYREKKLLQYIKLNEINIVHCRSYHSAFEAISLKDKYDLDYKVVFDPRGLFPEESSIKKKVKYNEGSYNYLKGIERTILEKSDVTISLSKPMRQHFVNLGAENCELVYASSKVVEFDDSLKNSIITFCYIGALTEDAWHSPSELFRTFNKIKRVSENARLLIISPTEKSKIFDSLGECCSNDIEVVSAKNSTEVMKLASKCHIGLLPFRVPESVPEELVGETMVGTKTLEYISSSIPIFANKYCGGARELINEYSLGVCYDPENILDSDIEQVLKINISGKAKLLVANLFSDEFNANRYNEIYKSLK